jgi:hypothetical protein
MDTQEYERIAAASLCGDQQFSGANRHYRRQDRGSKSLCTLKTKWKNLLTQAIDREVDWTLAECLLKAKLRDFLIVDKMETHRCFLPYGQTVEDSAEISCIFFFIAM